LPIRRSDGQKQPLKGRSYLTASSLKLILIDPALRSIIGTGQAHQVSLWGISMGRCLYSPIPKLPGALIAGAIAVESCRCWVVPSPDDAPLQSIHRSGVAGEEN
jgi:hypothetical protein